MHARARDHVTEAARRGLAAGLAATMALGLTPGTQGQVRAAMSLATGTMGPAEGGAASSPADLSAQAIERFKAKDYDAAVRLFQEAYALDPVPNYLFNIGRVYEEKGDIRAAVDYYQRFVKEAGVELEAREQGLQRLRVLKGILQETDEGEQKPDEAQPAPQPEEAKAAPEPAPAAPAPDPKWRTMTLAGAGVLGLGGAVMVAGGALGGVALSKQNQLDSTHDYDARTELAAQGRKLAVTTDVLIGVGGALVLTGVILVAVGATRGRTKAVADRRVWPTGLGVVARF